MKKVFLEGYWASNLGDDLFVKVIAERYPHVKFYLFANNKYKNTFINYRNIKVVSYDILDNFFVKVYRKFHTTLINNNFNLFNYCKDFIISKMDAFVVIGGSIFMENENWRNQVSFYEKSTNAVDYSCILGSNFGPYHTDNFLFEHKELFKLFDDICFRDMHSYQLFKQLPNIRVSPDIVFQLKYKTNPCQTLKSVSIVVMNLEKSDYLKTYAADYYKKLSDFGSYYISKGFNVKLISFCDYEKDDEAVDAVYTQLTSENKLKTKRYYYRDNINTILSELGASNHIIATRFHAMILGFVMNKYVFPINYSRKMNNVINDINFEGMFVDIENIRSVDPETVYSNIERHKLDAKKLAEQSEKHFLMLDQFLN